MTGVGLQFLNGKISFTDEIFQHGVILREKSADWRGFEVVLVRKLFTRDGQCCSR